MTQMSSSPTLSKMDPVLLLTLGAKTMNKKNNTNNTNSAGKNKRKRIELYS